MTPRCLEADLAAGLRDELYSRDFYTAGSRVAVRTRDAEVELTIGDVDGAAHTARLDAHQVNDLIEMLLVAKLGRRP